MATKFATGEISTQAEQWGLWARGGLGLMACHHRESLEPSITDEEGLLFDKAVLLLKMHDDRAFKVIRRHYVADASLAQIAIELDCSRSLVKTIHQSALFYLAGCMDTSHKENAFCEIDELTYQML